jgi:predicted nucleic acid-binding protein
MIAADTSAWIDYSKGTESRGAKQLETALSHGTLVMPLPVVFEILSGPGLTKEAEGAIQQLPQLEILSGFWQRAGTVRRKLLQKGFKARAMDCLIAQNCMDHDIVLIAADTDYRHFQKMGLKLI